ncbi:hypothetical protein WJX72_004712 [[Myrmecia] bisecta]|uniref:Cytochrome P450 n=1 Tax=[Myrmecia] bisecta TaxID=41462 RepID=A0AAW1PVQ0_9CHLO
MPSPPRKLIVGHMLDVLAPNFHRVFTRWAGQYGGIYRISVMGFPGVVVSDPEAVSHILGRAGCIDLPKHTASYQVLDLLWGNKGAHSIFTSLSNEDWRDVRKAVSSSFSSVNVRQKFPIATQKAHSLADAIAAVGSKQSVDMDEAGMRLTLDIVGLAGFGHDFGAVSLGENRVITTLPHALEECQRRMTNPLQWLNFWTKESRDAMKCVYEFRQIIAALVAEMKARGPPPDSDTSVGAQLLRLRDPKTGAPLPDHKLAAEVGTFIMGGFETTAHTLSFTLFCIATNPAVKAGVLAELDKLGLVARARQPARELKWDDLAKMTYRGNVLKESMRMFPVVAGVPRYTTQPTQIGPYKVPKGVFVYVLFHHLHNSPGNWSDPDVFNPDRWLDDDEMYYQPAADGMADDKDANRFKKFLPFSEGPRSCIGQNMAMMELKAGIATLCARFDFQLAPEMGGVQGVIGSEIMALTLHTRHGIRMHCTPHMQ